MTIRHPISIARVVLCLGFMIQGCEVTEPDLPADLDTQFPHATIAPGDVNVADVFGSPMDLDGNRLLVSAIGKSNNQGAVYVFEKDGALWSQTAKLTPPESTGNEWFGRAVALEGNTIVVGAPLKNNISGAAYVFTQTDSAWALQAELVPSDPQVRDFFGWTVGITNRFILVGAPNEVENPQREGALYAFERTGETWVETDRIVGEAAQPGDAFAIALDVDGPQAAVGTASLTGGERAAYIYTLEGNRWQRQARLRSPNNSNQDTFGWSVCLDGNQMAVGAPNSTRNGGLVYLYQRSGSSWDRQATIAPGAANPAPYFGWALALRGNQLAVGAIGGTSTAAGGIGYAFAFQQSGDDWTAKMRFAPDAPETRNVTDRFGHAIKLTDTELIVGAPDVGSMQGAVFAFDAIP